jgi:catechol 2,3-dioxygenase-like lactoylglutathione lyase family enzyme
MTTKHAALDRIDHVAIQVSDIGRAIAWYQARFRTQIL